jgi:hypothetical protein
MKKIATLIFVSSVLVFFLNINYSLAVGLQDAFKPSSGLATFANKSGYVTDNPATPEYYIGLALNVLFSLLGIIAIGLIVYSGIVWMTARGNESKVEKAKDTLTESIIGLLFIVGGYALTMFLLQFFAK